MIAVQYDQTNFIGRPFVNITLTQTHFHRLLNGTTIKNKTNIDLEPCTMDHFKNLPSYNQNWTYIFQLDNLQDFLCLKRGIKFQIGGIFENKDFYYLKFAAQKCVNSTYNPNKPWNPVCESQETVAQKQNQDSRIRFYIANNMLNPEKAEKSISSYLDSALFNFQMGSMYTNANLYLNQQTLVTDESLFPISNLNTIDLIQYKVSETWQQFAMGNFDQFCEIYFRRSNYSTVTQRSYMKIAQVISYIGGFCQVFILVSAFLVRKYNSYNMYLELANKLYNFESAKEQKLMKQSSQRINTNHNSGIDNNFNTQENNNQNILQHLSNHQDKLKTNQQNISSEKKIQTQQQLEKIELQQQNQIEQSVKNVIKQVDNNQRNQEIEKINNDLSNQQQITKLVPLEQIKKVLMESGLGQYYYQTDYFDENIDDVDQTQFSENIQKKIQKLNGIQKKKRENDSSVFQKETENDNLNIKQNQNQLQMSNFSSQFKNNEDVLGFKNHQKVEENSEVKLALKNEDISLMSFNQDIHLKSKAQPLNRIYTQIENAENTQNQKSANMIEKKQLENTEKSATKLSSRKNVFESNNKFSQFQIKRVASQFVGESPSNKNMTKIVQQKYGGAAEQFLENEFKAIIEREKGVWVSFRYFVNQITCGKLFNNDNIQLINKARTLIREDLDIFNILDRQKEVEKMKKLFLNEDQQVLFNFFPKPVISIASNENQLSMKDLKQEQINLQKSVSQVQKQSKKLNLSFKSTNTVAKAIFKLKKGKNSNFSTYQKLFNHYLKLSQEQNEENNNVQAAINKKLIHLLGDEMRNIFEVAKKMQQKPEEKQQANQQNLPSQYYQSYLRSTKFENTLHTNQPQNTQDALNNIQNFNQQQQQQIQKQKTLDSIFASSNHLQEIKNNIQQKQVDPQLIEVQLEEDNQTANLNQNQSKYDEQKI